MASWVEGGRKDPDRAKKLQGNQAVIIDPDQKARAPHSLGLNRPIVAITTAGAQHRRHAVPTACKIHYL
jgi:hypothetical protein